MPSTLDKPRFIPEQETQPKPEPKNGELPHLSIEEINALKIAQELEKNRKTTEVAEAKIFKLDAELQELESRNELNVEQFSKKIDSLRDFFSNIDKLQSEYSSMIEQLTEDETGVDALMAHINKRKTDSPETTNIVEGAPENHQTKLDNIKETLDKRIIKQYAKLKYEYEKAKPKLTSSTERSSASHTKGIERVQKLSHEMNMLLARISIESDEDLNREITGETNAIIEEKEKLEKENTAKRYKIIKGARESRPEYKTKKGRSKTEQSQKDRERAAQEKQNELINLENLVEQAVSIKGQIDSIKKLPFVNSTTQLQRTKEVISLQEDLDKLTDSIPEKNNKRSDVKKLIELTYRDELRKSIENTKLAQIQTEKDRAEKEKREILTSFDPIEAGRPKAFDRRKPLADKKPMDEFPDWTNYKLSEREEMTPGHIDSGIRASNNGPLERNREREARIIETENRAKQIRNEAIDMKNEVAKFTYGGIWGAFAHTLKFDGPTPNDKDYLPPALEITDGLIIVDPREETLRKMVDRLAESKNPKDQQNAEMLKKYNDKINELVRISTELEH